ncbi:MAG: NADH:ubiquinone reductase (Na(+)-transporting) subunit C [Paludibacteraceae bacterium]|nr:NADH:ubiquinone reductase (Na(+)-transporting) subunit C [Paludibacteraceae bacterium]MBR6519817.1 NADH:ubiquinone reductase (Na(+)-transporting) subunit C [Paludibacteraceae bacterium]
MNTNKNSYTLIYMVVIITIVSLLLSITSGSLRSFQEDNVRLDTKKQILNSLPGIELGEDAAATYAATIKEYNMLDAEGNVVKTLDPVADFDVKAEEGQFPMYVAEIDGETKYILPMNGAGLWGAIWGYMALNDDRNTVFGVFFNHAGETPGLGAEIVTEKFRNPFIGKELLKNGKFASIAIEKAGTKVEGRDQVDAISGGTITSKGVEAMLSSSLVNYENFLTAPAAVVVEEVADSVIVEPVIEGGN